MASETNKTKIVETALQMFKRGGLKGVTMDDIAAAMNMSKRTLYETFSTKEELLAECLMLAHDSIEKKHREMYLKVDEPLLVALYMIRVNAMSNHDYHRLIEETERLYPEIHDRFFKSHINEFRDMIMNELKYAESKHYLRPNVDKGMIADFLCQYIQQQRSSDYANKKEQARKIHEIGFTILRGLLVTDAIAHYEKNEELFRKTLEDMYNEERE